MQRKYEFITDRHVITAAEAADAYGMMKSWSRDHWAVASLLSNINQEYAAEEWLLYNFYVMVAHVTTEFPIQGQVVEIGEIINQAGGMYMPLKKVIQGVDTHCSFISDEGYPISYGVYLTLNTPIVANDIIFTRAKYSRVR